MREGVLAAAKAQINQGRGFRFVAASPAADFHTLADRARKMESVDEFTESLKAGRSTHLALVADAWGVVHQEDAWSLLQKVDVVQFPFDALVRTVRTSAAALVRG